MLKVCPLIDLFFKDESSWTKRAEKIAACGYEAVETWGGSDPAMLKAISAGGVKLASIVMVFADEAGIVPVNPANRQAFLDRIDRYMDNALAAGCPQGIVTAGQQVGGLSHAHQRSVLTENLALAGELAARRGFSLNLEPLNTEVDHAGYFLSDPAEAVSIAKETGCANVNVLYDIYHMAIMRGNHVEFLRYNIDRIGHFHVAGVPGRHEPAGGETNYPRLLGEIEKSGYKGYIGLEYFPLLESRESLEETKRYFQIAR